MSPSPLPVPGPCRAAYDRYAADLGGSALAASTRKHHARCVRRFLRWLPASSADIAAVLTQPAAWDRAAARFTRELAAAAGALSPDVQSHRDALADCARRLGLAEPYVSVPERFRWAADAYAAAAATTGHATATRSSNLAAVRAFLRWLDRSSFTGDLRRDWDTATTHYLHHLAGKGNAPSSVLRQRAALNHCATCLDLPRGGASAPTAASPNRAPTLSAGSPPKRRPTALAGIHDPGAGAGIRAAGTRARRGAGWGPGSGHRAGPAVDTGADHTSAAADPDGTAEQIAVCLASAPAGPGESRPR